MKNLHLTVILLASLAASCQPLLAGPVPGFVVGWGYNGTGAATGVRTTNPPNMSNNATGVVTVAGGILTNAVAIAAGGSFALALRSDGVPVFWGGPLAPAPAGSGTRNSESASGEVEIGGQVLSNVTAIAAGCMTSENFCLGLKRDGTVIAWGDNNYGRASVPPGLSNVVAITAGALQGLALTRDGTLVSWGQGNPPPNWLSNVVAIAAGGESGQNLALRRDGTVAEWPVLSAEYVSTVPAGLSNVVAIATAGGARLALQAGGTVVGWGANRYGQATGIPTPLFPSQSTGTVMIAGQVLTNVAAIAAGFEYSVAVKKDGTVVTWGHPLGMQIAPPAGLSNVTAIAAGYDFCLAITTNTDWQPRSR